ncbi:solute carrier family 41 member 1 [Aethina tumida]|uniref:solute carrier family 41 member 1 n=1 Tax=Aethina tumida TaxID=116153 RepID=UPI00096B4D57|nr:solute carrier family 41 member 1 [Aethina tumida]XP_049819984.1 solute carrier family 41 member 1 [Aethina tumida]
MAAPGSEKDESQSQMNQLTVSTIISLDDACKNNNYKNGVGKVESLSNGKSIESIVSQSSETESYQKTYDKEKWYNVTLQVFIPFMIAGIGTIGAGIVLDTVQGYQVFKEIKALYILVPALLGLKGNLDMCLASRLSTQANLGNLKDRKEILKIIFGNIGLVQIQAIVASCCVSVFAITVSGVTNGTWDYQHAMLLAASATLTATLSCFVLDFVLIAVIFISKRFKLNPDNVATPFAASIGDVVSITVLSLWSKLLYEIHETYPWLLFLVLGAYWFVILPIWLFFVRRNDYTKKILTSGWTPVLTALIISGMGGLVLDQAVDQFTNFVVFQPIINGIGGNLVSVQSSRISTMLHKTSIKGVIPPHTKQWVAPWTALIAGVLPAKSARILILMSIPGQIIFVLAADALSSGGVTVSAYFVTSYLSVSLLQIMLLLYIAHLMIHTMWVHKIDPDNSAIPYLTSLGDLLGSSLLLLAFIFLRAIHQDDDIVT